MRNTLYLSLLLVLASCKKEDTSNIIIGEWETYRIEIWQEDYDPTQPLTVDEDTRAIYKFDSDGNYDDGGIQGMYSVKDNEITVYSRNETIDMNYSFSGMNLILKYTIDKHTAKVFLKRLK